METKHEKFIREYEEAEECFPLNLPPLKNGFFHHLFKNKKTKIMEKITNEQSIELYKEFLQSPRELNKKTELALIKFDLDTAYGIRPVNIEKTEGFREFLMGFKVTNYSDFPQKISLLNPDYIPISTKIEAIFHSLTYEEIMRLLLVREVDVSSIYIEVIKGNIEEVLKQRIIMVRKGIQSSLFSAPIEFDEVEYEKQQIKSIMHHHMNFTIKPLTYFEYNIPANTQLQFSFIKNGDQSDVMGISPYAGIKGDL